MPHFPEICADAQTGTHCGVLICEIEEQLARVLLDSYYQKQLRDGKQKVDVTRQNGKLQFLTQFLDVSQCVDQSAVD